MIKPANGLDVIWIMASANSLTEEHEGVPQQLYAEKEEVDCRNDNN